MSAHISFRCDMCATEGSGRWGRYGMGTEKPKGWKTYDGAHLCGYECLIEHLKELAGREAAQRLFDRAPDSAVQS